MRRRKNRAACSMLRTEVLTWKVSVICAHMRPLFCAQLAAPRAAAMLRAADAQRLLRAAKKLGRRRMI